MKALTEKEELEERLEDVIADIKVGKLGCGNCKVDTIGKGVEKADETRPKKKHRCQKGY